MFLTNPFFKSFTQKELTDPDKSIEVMLAVSYESRVEMDRLADIALQLGAKENRREDLGFMYTRSFSDLVYILFHKI
jgi:predicted lactoylglutathione lyase